MSLERAKLFKWERMLFVTVKQQLKPKEMPRELRLVYPAVSFLVYQGDLKKREALRDEVAANQIVLATYENFSELNPEDFDCYIFDEFHLASNRDSNRYKRLVPFLEATWRKPDIPVQLLTGTPIGNQGTVNMWTLLHARCPLTAGSYNAFLQKHQVIEAVGSRTVLFEKDDGTMGSRKVFYIKESSLGNADLFKQKLDAGTFRISEDEIMKFKRTTKFIDVDMTPAQWEYYNEAKDDLLDVETTSRLGLKSARVKLLRLLQIAEGLFNLPEEETNFESGKLNYLLEALTKARYYDSTDKRVVWFRFAKAPKLLHHLYKDRSVLWSGAVNDKDKELAQVAFNGTGGDPDVEREYKKLAYKRGWKFEPGEAQFFFGVIDLRASLGMNLQSCHHQIVSSFSLSVIANIQSFRRIMRADTEADEIITEILRARGTWEAPAFNYILNKWKTAKSILDGKESVVHNDLVKLMSFLGTRRARNSRFFLE